MPDSSSVTVSLLKPVHPSGWTTKRGEWPGVTGQGSPEDRSEKETRHYVIDRVHEDTRVLSLIDGDGVLVRQKIGDLTSDWRLFNSENLSVVPGEKLIAVAGDKQAGLKAKDRLTVTAVSDKGIEATIEGKKIIVPTDRPLYVSHAYVASPGNRDNEAGTVLAALNARDITGQTMNSLAQSGAKAEIFTSEAQDKAEAGCSVCVPTVPPSACSEAQQQTGRQRRRGAAAGECQKRSSSRRSSCHRGPADRALWGNRTG
jgi:hypothetical protein